jgi:hypothetical protein
LATDEHGLNSLSSAILSNFFRFDAMKMLILAIIVFSVSPLRGQETKSTTYCSSVLEQINTKEWIKDSLGITGYRAKFFEGLKNCKADKVTKNVLLEKLGPPVFKQKTAFGKPWKTHIQYVYYILNVDEIGKIKPFQGLYIAFVLDENETSLELVINGDYCG